MFYTNRMNIYDYDDYKDYLSAHIKTKKGVRGYQGILAESAKCHPSYFSQALKGKQELTPDQGINIAIFLNLNSSETQYFMNLLSYARAFNPDLKKFLKLQIESQKNVSEKLSDRIIKQDNVQEVDSIYYSSWMWLAVHMITSCPEFQNAEMISKRLNIEMPKLIEILKKLESMGLIVNENSQWRYLRAPSHLPAESHMTEMNHFNWRNRAILDVQKGHVKESIHYSSVFTMSKKDYSHLRNRIFNMIDESRKLIGPSDSEEAYSFCCDVFKV